ncbi:MAG TPA: hypothetical protein PKD85_03185 [Saprospiraceae bacterium]|nr:hypothetical protein [Saprospiraceae bacterium]
MSYLTYPRAIDVPHFVTTNFNPWNPKPRNKLRSATNTIHMYLNPHTQFAPSSKPPAIKPRKMTRLQPRLYNFPIIVKSK